MHSAWQRVGYSRSNSKRGRLRAENKFESRSDVIAESLAIQVETSVLELCRNFVPNPDLTRFGKKVLRLILYVLRICDERYHWFICVLAQTRLAWGPLNRALRAPLVSTRDRNTECLRVIRDSRFDLLQSASSDLVGAGKINRAVSFLITVQAATLGLTCIIASLGPSPERSCSKHRTNARNQNSKFLIKRGVRKKSENPSSSGIVKSCSKLVSVIILAQALVAYRASGSSVLVGMALAYKDVEKLNKETGAFEHLYPLRVAGLCYEKGHKVVHERGPKQLNWEQDLRTVRVSGTVRVREGRGWRSVRAVTLTVRDKDAELGQTLVKKQLGVLQKDWVDNLPPQLSNCFLIFV